MQQSSRDLWQPVTSLYRNRNVIWQLAKRDVVGRYKGSLLGLLWSFLNPLFMLAVYTFFFSVVFAARWKQGVASTRGEFALALFVGLIIHSFFAECANKGPSLVTSNPSYVTKIIFPLEIFPVVSALSALFHASVSLLVLLVFLIAFAGAVPPTFLYFPLILLPLAILCCAVGWLLAGLGVYVRDVSQTIGILVMVMMYTSPVFFPISLMPAQYRHLLYLNPLTILIIQGREIMLWGHKPDFSLLGLYTVGVSAAAWLCFCWFQKMRRGFADVL